MNHLSQDTLSQAMHWLVNGSIGLSSKCLMATIIHGQPIEGGWDAKFHPRDPSDLKRCIGLLDAVPAFRSHFGIMKTVSKEWEILVRHWEELESTFKAELQLHPNRAPQTNDLMRSLFKSLEGGNHG
jgi:hypothetical protein